VPGLGTQASLQKRFSLCEMPLVELAEQLTLIELGMFRYHLNGRGIGSCAVPLISSFLLALQVNQRTGIPQPKLEEN
jgi:hypothetical protein